MCDFWMKVYKVLQQPQCFGGFWEMLFCDYWVKACWWWVIFSLSSCAVWFRALLPCWTAVPSPTAFFPPAQDCHVLWWWYWVWSLVFLQVPVQLNSGHKESGFPCFPEYMPKPSSFLVKVRPTGHHNTDHVGSKDSRLGARRAWASCSCIRGGPLLLPFGRCLRCCFLLSAPVGFHICPPKWHLFECKGNSLFQNHLIFRMIHRETLFYLCIIRLRIRCTNAQIMRPPY